MKTVINYVAVLFLSSVVGCSNAFAPPHQHYQQQQQQQQHRCSSSVDKSCSGLMIRFDGSSSSSTQLAAKQDSKKGVYARPSAAIERGSGFFIPGLEGPRVRLLFGITILILTAINHFIGHVDVVASSKSSFSETLAVGYAVLLLLQAAIEFGKEDLGYVVSTDNDSDRTTVVASASTEGLVQQWAETTEASSEWKERVQWSAASYASLTPATQMLFLKKDAGVLYSLGKDDDDTTKDTMSDANAASSMDGCRAALETLSQAKSGRVSLPTTHPAATALVSANARCVVLQTIDDNHCWMMTSDTQLLQAFTKQDLKWLGQLASYVRDD
eukprot:CAMPEP_0119005476 /NCGR_PEP_ID=MMETSP1176-20130426/1745_1 /TAXON_ID=265551 /ORGANISM="Synedropsis recta cf, Strain CCMP1620" /LENGTH=327 /DNA_ID=CAMNT_0006957289 /DNA_START=122 /DNA_END=1105 /DNA_ORIENTATION=-